MPDLKHHTSVQWDMSRLSLVGLTIKLEGPYSTLVTYVYTSYIH